MRTFSEEEQRRIDDFFEGRWVVDDPDDPDTSRQKSDEALAALLCAISSPAELFEFMVQFDSEMGHEVLRMLVDHPLADSGVLLLAYWKMSPAYYTRKRSEAELHPYQIDEWHLLQHIHSLVHAALDQPTTTHFDPQAVDFLDGRDLTRRARKYPSHGWYVIPERFYESV